MAHRIGEPRIRRSIVVATAAAVSLAMLVSGCSSDTAKRAKPGRTTTTAAPIKSVDMAFTKILGADGQFERFRDLMQVGSYWDQLVEDQEYTILAPSTEAIDALGEATVQRLMAGPSDELKALLGRHIVPGKLKLADIVAKAPSGLDTVDGQHLDVTTDGEVVTIGGAPVTKSDIESEQGVIHVLGTVADAAE